MNTEAAAHLIAILSVGIFVSLPLITDCGLSAYDFIFHLVASQNFADEVWQGAFYPRWLGDMNAGFGSPTFFFYAPVPYYINTLLEPIADLSGNVCLPVALGAVLALVASGFAAYFWLRGSAAPAGAALGAILYILLPYHLSINLYLRFAYAEFWAFVWMPLALLFARRLAIGSSRSVVGLSVSLGLLACTHLPTFLIFFPVPIGYALVLSSASGRKKLLARLGLSALLAAGLSAIYVLPALSTQQWVSMNEMSTEKLLYSNNFLRLSFSEFADVKNFFASFLVGSSIQLGPSVFLPLSTILLSVCIVTQYAEKSVVREAIYLAVIGCASIFMMFEASRAIWDALPVLQRIQFPSRFQTVLSPCLAGMAALAVSSIRSSLRTPLAQAWNARWRASLFLVCTVIILILQLAVLGNRLWQGEGTFMIRIIRYAAAAGLLILLIPSLHRLRRWSWRRLIIIVFWFSVLLLMSRQDYEQIFSARINPAASAYVQSRISAAPEHFPRWITPENRKPPALQSWSARTPRVRIIGTSGSAQVSRWRSRSIRLGVDLPKPAIIDISQFYYPGWNAHLLPRGRPLPVQPSAEGLLQMVLPEGTHDVQLVMDGIPNERLGTIISTLSFACLLLLLIRKHRPMPSASRLSGQVTT